MINLPKLPTRSWKAARLARILHSEPTSSAFHYPGATTVLVLNQYALPRSQGGGTRHIDLFARLTDWRAIIVAASRNHATQEIFATEDEHFVLVDVPPYNANGMARVLGWAIYAYRCVRIGLKTRPLDVVYASTPHLLTPLAGLIIAKLRHKPLVLEVRDLWPESIVAAGQLTRGSRLHRMLILLEKRLYARATRIVVVTSGWESHFATFGIESTKLVVIPNGTELTDFHVDQTKWQLRQLWNITKYTAIFAGSHGPKDGIDFILDASEKTPHIHFLLVGGGISKSAAMERVRDSAIHNVEFRDSVSKEDLPSLLAACDVGIHAVTPLSVFDKGMSPNKLFDYLAAGLPVVSNARHQLRDIVADDICGRFGGPDDLADCLDRVRKAEPPTQLRWRTAATALMEDRFSRRAAALRLTDLLTGVV